MPFVLDPHGAGELGPGSRLDTSVHPPVCDISSLDDPAPMQG